LISVSAVRSGGCRPSRMEAVMSGAKKASLRLRATYRSSLFLRSAICLIEGALPRQSSRHHVRFTLKSGHAQHRHRCPRCANRRHRPNYPITSSAEERAIHGSPCTNMYGRCGSALTPPPGTQATSCSARDPGISTTWLVRILLLCSHRQHFLPLGRIAWRAT